MNVNLMVYQVSGIYPLTSGRKPAHSLATMLVMLVSNLMLSLYHNFGPSVKEKMNALVLSKRAVFPPKPKGLGGKTDYSLETHFAPTPTNI